MKRYDRSQGHSSLKYVNVCVIAHTSVHVYFVLTCSVDRKMLCSLFVFVLLVAIAVRHWFRRAPGGDTCHSGGRLQRLVQDPAVSLFHAHVTSH